MNRPRSRVSMAGLSLIELMVSMLIALIILAGVIQSVFGSKRAFMHEEQVAYIQENARFAIDYISRDVRQAGYMGCDSGGNRANSLDNTTLGLSDLVQSSGIGGLEGGVSALPALLSTADPDTDVFFVRYADVDSELIVQGHNPMSAVIQTVGTNTIPVGTVLVMSNVDCDQQGIFEKSGPNNLLSNNVNHGTGTSNNCTTMLGGTFRCSDCNMPAGNSCTGGNPFAYGPGSSLFLFKSYAYFIDEASFDSTLPALHRIALDGTEPTGRVTEELVSGVEDMQILYGIDTDAAQDGEANRYYTADLITAEIASAATLWVGWDRVVSLRVQLVMRSRDQILPAVNTTAYLGNTPADRYLRQIVSTTIQVRNAGL